METIFDHNITADERDQLGIDESTREEYEAVFSQQSAYIDLYSLMGLREDSEAKAHYYGLIDDKSFIDFNIGYQDLVTS